MTSHYLCWVRSYALELGTPLASIAFKCEILRPHPIRIFKHIPPMHHILSLQHPAPHHSGASKFKPSKLFLGVGGVAKAQVCSPYLVFETRPIFV